MPKPDSYSPASLSPASLSPDDFLDHVATNRLNQAILTQLPKMDLPKAFMDQAYLVAGCLFQTVWNLKSGQAPDTNIKDYDIFYFDGDDLSYEGEDKIIRAVAAEFGPDVEVRNQARVHLWYRQKFGLDRAPIISSADGISGFLVTGTCIGIHVANGTIEAPFGLRPTYDGILTPNPRLNMDPLSEVGQRNRVLYDQKARSYKDRWPFLALHAH